MWGNTICGTPAAAAVVVVPRAAVVHDGGRAAEQRLLVDLADGEAVRCVELQVRPAPLQDNAFAERAGRRDGMPHRVLGGAHAAEAEVDRRCTAVQERFERGGERALVVEEPGTGLRQLRRSRPRAEHRVRGEPRGVAEDVVADVVDRAEAEFRSFLVQGVAGAHEVLAVVLPLREVLLRGPVHRNATQHRGWRVVR
ncbi:hypothetical protein Lesp01_32710 [Lentzea sp. NBRC 102530]|nr:hypothetical protein Lesp01_32710 [Lentzea sp. NBRC 102530]